MDQQDKDNQADQKFSRSISLPEARNSTRAREELSKLLKIFSNTRKSRSLNRSDDQSNSAAPTRRQPHPFAMHAIGLRPNFIGRTNRLPEWPPPDPPPLTPLNFGMTRNMQATQPNNGPIIWPPRPWWRRNGLGRPLGPVVHVTIDTADMNNPIPVRLVDRPARIGWTNTSEEVEPDVEPAITIEQETPAPQQASMNEVEDSTYPGDPNSSLIATTSRPLQSMESVLNQASWAQLRIHQGASDSMVMEQSSNVQLPAEDMVGITAVATEDVGMISLSSEEVQEESTFQIFFVVLDSNPTAHAEFRPNEPELGFLPLTLANLRERYQLSYGTSREDMQSYNDSSDEHS